MTITNTYIYNIKERPSKYSFLVAIPFNMYRIQTHKYSDGLNFFQRAVLKFLAKPGIGIEMISSIMDVDSRLVEIVVKQLKKKKYIDSDNLLTDEGRFYRNSAMGIVVDPTEKKIGYVFQMCDRDEYYPFYVNAINVVQSYVNNDYIFITDKHDLETTMFFSDKKLFNNIVDDFLTKIGLNDILKEINKTNEKAEFERAIYIAYQIGIIKSVFPKDFDFKKNSINNVLDSDKIILDDYYSCFNVPKFTLWIVPKKRKLY